MTVSTTICEGLQNDSWCPGGPESFRVPYAVHGTVGQVATFLLDFIWPLNEWLDGLMGDEAQVWSFAETWRRTSGEVGQLRGEIESAGLLVKDFEGSSSEAMRSRIAELVAMLDDGQRITESVAVALEHAVQIVVNLHDALVGAITEIIGVAGELARPWNWDLNPFDGNETIDRIVGHVQRFVEHIGILLDAMFDAFDNLLRMLGELHPWMKALIDSARKVASSLSMGAGMVSGGVLGGIVAGAPGALVGTAVGALLGSAASDPLAPDPTVTRLDPVDGAPSNLEHIDSVEQLVRQNGYTDALGGRDASAVDIKAVQTPDGVTYVVSLPSTQDWGLLEGAMGEKGTWTTDRGATNDLDSNIDLMLAPYTKTQYERAVMQVMADAGIPPGADVVYTGFSQGGIMAANLASDANSPYDCVGIITNGAPIQTFDIPSDVPVLAFQHEGDIVPGLDGNKSWHDTEPNQHTITLPPPVDENGVPKDLHHSDNYADSVATYLAAHPEMDDDFAFLYGDVIDHQQYTWSE